MQTCGENTIQAHSFKPGRLPARANGHTVVIVSCMKTTAGATPGGSAGDVVILGASVRGLATSAARAGWNVYAADLFCDLDLQAVAQAAMTVAHKNDGDALGYPWNLLAAATEFPPDAVWCYTGAIENHPELVDAIARVRPLAGNTAECIRRLRDPAAVATAAVAAGLAFPETRPSPDDVPLDGTWLVKPLAGAGGRGIRRWTPAAAAESGGGHVAMPHPISIWQRFVSGTPLSAAYCFSRRRSQFLGASRQLIGEPWCHASQFAWCGAVTLHTLAGLPKGKHLGAALERLGSVLAERFHPVGLVGVDLVVDADGHLTVIEINPRPTASMELFERSGAGSIADSHLAACGCAPECDNPPEPLPRQPASTWAKAVLFAAEPTVVSRPLIEALARESDPWTQADGGWPALADIPQPGQTVPVGAPVITIFAVSHSAADAIALLRDRVARVDALLSSRS